MAQAVVERGGEQRREKPAGADAGPAQQVRGLGDQGDQVVGAGDQRRVVEPPVLLGHEERFAAHLQDEGLGDRPVLRAAGHPEGGTEEAVGVLGCAGEGHGRVQGQGQDALRSAGASTASPWRRRCEGQLAGAPRAGLGEAGDQARQRVVGDGEHDEVGGGDDLVGGDEGDAGKQPGGALGRGGGDARGGDDVMAGGGERGTEDGADTSGADDTHAEAGGRGGCRGSVRQHGRACGEQASLHLSFQSLAGTGRRSRSPPWEAAWYVVLAVLRLTTASRCNRMCRAG